MSTNEQSLDLTTRILHLGMLIFGISAWIVGGYAGDYKHAVHTGFSIHRWLGIGTVVFVTLRILYGIVGPRSMRFVNWVPYTPERLRYVREDIVGLLRLRIPDRPTHVGLAGFVQAYGLLVFTWMAISGTFMFVEVVPGSRATGFVHAVMEAHQFGDSLIWIYLVLHVGAVLAHSALGQPVWRRMFFK